jgi:putative transposase
MSAPDRRALVDRGHGTLSVRRQCELVSIARSGVYRPPRPAKESDLALMRRIDELFMACRSSARAAWRRCCKQPGGR